MLRRLTIRLALVALLLPAAACTPEDPGRPDVLWIVWDTARADRMSLYGHQRETTPFLEEWARGARVYDDVVSPAPYTLPSHASMFTGLLPSEHCTHNGNRVLHDSFTTIAELLQESGYRTYLYSANPHVSTTGGLAQGFEVEEHPWSEGLKERALEIVQAKLAPGDTSSELPGLLADVESGQAKSEGWHIKASGELAQEATTHWLDSVGEDESFFVFLNYMEAHRPWVPSQEAREAMLSGKDLEDSYTVDRSWDTIWQYVFGVHDYTERELELIRGTYDATLLELDRLLENLLGELDRRGRLDNTIVILTSDHGEHLGEHRRMDHQYSLYHELLNVPLVVHYPRAFEAGRDANPVMSFDLFPTLLELTGVEPAPGAFLTAVSLFDSAAGRERFAEDPRASRHGVRMVRQLYPDVDFSPWFRETRALYDGDEKFIWGSNGVYEYFNLADDPGENVNLLESHPDRALELGQALLEYHAGLYRCDPTNPGEPVIPESEVEMLRGLGYVD